MGGDITVASRDGGGSIFHFEIPLTRCASGVTHRQSAPRRVIGIRGAQSPRVLVVDDQAENRDWLIKLLSSIGFSAQAAENGEAAIRRWQEWNPQLILMDVHMPVMDGLEATRRIKGEPRGKETLIAVLTASALADDRKAVFQSGADDFLTKPCREDELLEKMRLLLGLEYVYEEMSETQETPVSLANLNSATLRRLPQGLLGQLYDATRTGNKKLLNALIPQSEASDVGCAHALQELADKYEYDVLTRLLEEACRP